MILKPPLFVKPIHGHPLGPAGGLVGLWPFNEGSGPIVNDLSGNSRTGTLGSGLIWQVGDLDSGVKGNNSAYITVANGCPSDYPFTLVAIYQFATSGSYQDIILSIGNSGHGGTNYSIGAYTTGSYFRADLYSRFEWEAEQNMFSANYVYPWNGSHTIVGVFRSATYREIFVDGKSIGTDTDSVAFGGNRIIIGARAISTPNNQIDGIILDAMIYNRTLSASEIAQLYREPFCMFEREPIELWTAATIGGVPPVGNAGIMTPNTGFWGPTF